MTNSAMVKKSKITSRVAGADILSQEELDALDAEASAKVLSDNKKAVSKAVLEEKLREKRSLVDPSEKTVEYRINLPTYAPSIVLDGAQYHHGQVYHFTRKQLSTILGIAQGAWDHQKAISTLDLNEYRQKKGSVLSGSSMFM